MIDPLHEDLLSPREATRLYPSGPDGKAVHVSVVYRHLKQGVRGVRLESIRTPRLATSRQAVARFFSQLSNQDGPRQVQSIRNTQRERAQDSVEHELDRLGL